MKAVNEVSTVKVYAIRDGYKLDVCSLEKRGVSTFINFFVTKYNDKDELKDILKQVIDGIDKLE